VRRVLDYSRSLLRVTREMTERGGELRPCHDQTFAPPGISTPTSTYPLSQKLPSRTSAPRLGLEFWGSVVRIRLFIVLGIRV